MPTKEYRPYHPRQVLILPPSLDEWLPEGHLAYFIDDLVEHFELSVIEATYEDELRGGPPYHPVMMVKVLLYAYYTGVYASRRIAKRVREDVAFRGGEHPRLPAGLDRPAGHKTREETVRDLGAGRVHITTSGRGDVLSVRCVPWRSPSSRLQAVTVSA